MTEEKRRYYRVQPREVTEPRADMEIDGREIDLTVVNISPGGILCYVSKDETGVEKGGFIDTLTVRMPEKKPVTYSGQIVRTQTTPDSPAKFCAIEFVQFGEKVLEKGSKPIKSVPPTDDTDRYYLHRLESIKFPSEARTIHAEIRINQMLYDAFSDIALRLAIEERWFFYEVLDSMKAQQPDYPDQLKMEFFRLCRAEDRSEFVKRKGSGNRFAGWLQGVFRRKN